MAKVKEKKARKEYKCQFTGETINPGDTYYTWTPYRSSKRISKYKPKASQSESNQFLSPLYAVREDIEAFQIMGDDNASSLKTYVEDRKDEIQSIIDEMEDAKSNLPEQFQETGPGEVLTERIDAANDWINELESASFEDYEKDDSLTEAEEQVTWKTWSEEQQKIINELAGSLNL